MPSLIDQRAMPAVLRVNLFKDVTRRDLGEREFRPVRMVHRPGQYRVMTAEDLEGEASLIQPIGKCTFDVK